MDIFRVRLNCVDHYQSAPTKFDPPLFADNGSTQHKEGPKVPVIRVFGATETGQKVCAHIHGALPYLYLEYHGSIEQIAVDAHIDQLRASIDHALAVSYRRNTYDGKARFVGHIALVKGIPFFGYHVGYRYFLKVYLLNPLNMTRFADLLAQGAILKRVLQPFESHLQYLLQWMCDFNLYGCAYIDCKMPKFRSPVPDYLEMNSLVHKWHDRSILSDWISDPIEFQKQSHCSIEVDIRVEDILNRNEVQPRHLHHDFVERFTTLSPQEKLIHSMAGLWKDETRRRKLRMGLTDASSSPFPPEVLVSMSADPRNTEKGGWVHEEEFRDMLKDLINQEAKKSADASVTFNDFITPLDQDRAIPTATEGVEVLFSHNLSCSFSGISKHEDEILIDQVTESTAALVDEAVVPKFDDGEFPYESDEDVARAIALSQQNHDDVTKQRSSHARISKAEADRMRKRQKLMPDERVDDGAQRNQSHANVLPKHGEQSQSRHGLFKRSDHPSNGKIEAKSSQEKITAQGKVASSQSSQGSIKTTGSQSRSTLSFPVVKDPFDPETILSLSQRDSLSSSQKSPDLLKSTPKHSTENSSERASSHNMSSSAPTTTSISLSAHPKLPPQFLQSFQDLASLFPVRDVSKMLVFGQMPPDADTVISTLQTQGLPQIVYQEAYYSDEKDVPERSRDYAGREFRLESLTAPYLASFDPTGKSSASLGEKPPVVVDKAKEDLLLERRKRECTLLNWEYLELPPSRAEVEAWLEREHMEPILAEQPRIDELPQFDVQYDKIKLRTKLSQIEGPTQKHEHGFKFSQKQKSTSVKHETQYMSIMSLEVHVNSRANLVPNPEEDGIACIFWCLKSDEEIERRDVSPKVRLGILILSENGGMAREVSRHAEAEVEEEKTELDLINRLVDIVREHDPDILTGFEVHNGSWGYLIERARLKYEYDLCDEFSRVKSDSHGRFGKDADRWGFNHTSTIRVTGRHMINIWRAMRSEVNLLQYTMENIVFHLLHKRIPHFTFQDLTSWYKSGNPRDLAKCLNYFVSRVQIDLEILEANELIPRTSEQARLIGVDFFSVFSRGSQYKVESFMFRLAKPENFILVSPSRKQVGQQNALECLPLVMEPQSNFYTSPVLVLDFQSLYPSIMIAYNYCYSTCLGRIVSWRDQNKMGFAEFKRQPRLLELVKDYINIAPNGMMYVRPEMRKSLLAKMLGEILETRVMVKSGMKVDKQDRTLQQLLNNRQLALKLLANVTYGYTSASFSGRMPCAEIADSIVQTARETLEKTIAKIHSVTAWGAEVVYGDTDSIFVLLKGRTKDQAFDIGNEIANTVTDMNPRPIKLKFEKVYLPCVLLAKKRYVGFKYESKAQAEPEFDAKGIETVRRDGTPAEQKIEEKALKILFRTADLSQVKSYFQRQATKIMLGKISIQDFCFAKEVKLGSYSDKGPPPPGALISTRRMLEDPRLEPQYGERVPYVVVTGAPGARLIDRCFSPETVLKGEGGVELDAEYYISKNLIPPLERIFNLVGANVRQWYDEMPKVQRIRELYTGIKSDIAGPHNALSVHMSKKTMESYMKSSSCLVCKTKLAPTTADYDGPETPICVECLEVPATSLHTLLTRLKSAQQTAAQLETVCRSCSGLNWAEEVRCDSKDCPVYYSRIRARTNEGRMRGMVGAVRGLLESEQGVLEW